MSKFIVVGASGGVGRDVTARLKNSGHEVFQISRTSLGRTCDFSDDEQVSKLVADTDFSDYAGIVNLAGSILIKPVQRVSTNEIETAFKQNFMTAFNTVKHFAPIFSTRGRGSIVLMSTVAAQIGLANHEVIAAAKSAVNGLTISAAASFAAKNVRVNAIAPSLINTPLGQKFLGSEKMKETLAGNHPLGRYGEPGDVSSLVVWLLDEQNSWMTGQVLSIDGGMSTLKKL